MYEIKINVEYTMYEKLVHSKSNLLLRRHPLKLAGIQFPSAEQFNVMILSVACPSIPNPSSQVSVT